MRKNKNDDSKSITNCSSTLPFKEKNLQILSDSSYAYLEDIVQYGKAINVGLEIIRVESFTINGIQRNNGEFEFKNSNDFYQLIQLFRGYQVQIDPKNKDTIVLHVRINFLNSEDYFCFNLTFIDNCNYFIFTPIHINPLYLNKEESIFLNELEILNEDIYKVLNSFRGH